MRKSEAELIVGAARHHGVQGADLEAVEQATRQTVAIDDVDVGALGPWQRVMAYAMSVWLAKLDGVVNADELASLRALAARLGVEDSQAVAARSAAMDLLVLPHNRPDRFDLTVLDEALQKRLPTLYGASAG
jgi:hypothetical protein